GGNRGNACGRVDKTGLPQGRDAQAISVVRVNAVMLGCDIYDIVKTLTWDIEVGDVKRGGMRSAIDWVRKQFAEGRGPHVRGVQGRFVEVLASAEIVVVVGVLARKSADECGGAPGLRLIQSACGHDMGSCE